MYERARGSAPQYLGLWYDLEHYEASFEQNTDCVTAEYSRYADGSIRVFNSAVRLTDGLLYAVDGLALLSYPEAEVLEAKLNVSFYGAREWCDGVFSFPRN